MLTGTQEIKEIEGQQIVFFNTGGTSYVQLVPSGGGYPSNYMVPLEYMGEVNIEALQVPGETYAGYPALRVFNVGSAVDPNTGEPIELYRLTDHIEVLPDPYGNADQYIQPNVTIEKIELVYIFSNPSYPEDSPEAQERYIQPAWHFHGHDDHGSELDIFIQALKPEYLSPEIAPAAPVG